MSGTLGTVSPTAGERAARWTFRCGSVSPKLDNYRRIRGDRGQFTSGALSDLRGQCRTPSSAGCGWKPTAPTARRPSGSSESRPIPR